MARILLGWELGAGAGHAVKLLEIGGILASRGHQPVFAVQNIFPFAAADAPLWQAPLWPSQLAMLARPAMATPATMGDILVALGLVEPGALAAMLGGWDAILTAVRPDAVAAEFAPALMLAARGRVPVLALGTGFSLPPPTMARMPSLTGAAPVHDEETVLAAVNAALVGAGRAAIDTLPAIFTATHALPAAFAEFDPYRPSRLSAAGTPSIMGEVPTADAGGEELFVYMNGAHPRRPGFWQGLHRSGLKVRVHDPRLTEADRALLRGAGFFVEEAPVPFAQVAARSRLVLSHGGLGFASSALIAGLPHIMMPYDIEKRLNADAVVAMGLGIAVPPNSIEAEPFAATLRVAMADDSLHARARAAAPAFAARMTSRSEEQAATIAAAIAI